MKNIKKLSLLLAVVLVLSFTLSLGTFANDDVKPIEDNDKIFTLLPSEYEISVFSDCLSYSDDYGNYIEFCVGENKFAPNGITSLEKGQIQKVFEHFYLYDGNIERIDECSVLYKTTEKTTANGYYCYYLSGKYAYTEEDIDSDFACFFNAYVFATKENVFIVGYEDIEGNLENLGELNTVVSGIVFNGTYFDGDKPERNGDHDFSNSPAYNDVVTAAQENFMSNAFEDDGMVAMMTFFIVLVTIIPTAVLIIIAIVLICKYSKNKKKLKRYELTYGSVPSYNIPPQNYGGYGYNQPVNAPYQPPVNPIYQQPVVNQNTIGAPSYVTNAVNNMGETPQVQPQQPVQSPETRKVENNESAGE